MEKRLSATSDESVANGSTSLRLERCRCGFASFFCVWAPPAYIAMRSSTVEPDGLRSVETPQKKNRMPTKAPIGSAYSMWLAETGVHVAEDVLRQLDAGGLELLAELRADARRAELADDLAVDVRGLLEDEHVLQHDRLAFHALDLGDVRDLARSILEAADLHDDVERGGHLLTDRAGGQVDTSHETHRLQPGEHVARRVRVAGGQRAVVTGIHGLEHREGLATTDLTDDDALRAHTKGVLDQVHD